MSTLSLQPMKRNTTMIQPLTVSKFHWNETSKPEKGHGGKPEKISPEEQNLWHCNSTLTLSMANTDEDVSEWVTLAKRMKPSPENLSTIKRAMDRTYTQRRIWITTQSPLLAEIFNQYPRFVDMPHLVSKLLILLFLFSLYNYLFIFTYTHGGSAPWIAPSPWGELCSWSTST